MSLSLLNFVNSSNISLAWLKG
uniref:Uncharacterized protein n=1 Tax=Arundo donax TaxID=35708 RepID=A0A0A8Y598_ARUDO